METFKDMLLTLIDQYDFMICHKRNKIKEVNKTIKRLVKVNEGIENKVDLTPYYEERCQHFKDLVDLKQDAKKLNRVYKILMKSE